MRANALQAHLACLPAGANAYSCISPRHSSRPGILVLVNDTDWELEGELDYQIQEGDSIMFISSAWSPAHHDDFPVHYLLEWATSLTYRHLPSQLFTEARRRIIDSIMLHTWSNAVAEMSSRQLPRARGELPSSGGCGRSVRARRGASWRHRGGRRPRQSNGP